MVNKSMSSQNLISNLNYKRNPISNNFSLIILKIFLILNIFSFETFAFDYISILSKSKTSLAFKKAIKTTDKSGRVVYITASKNIALVYTQKYLDYDKYKIRNLDNYVNQRTPIYFTLENSCNNILDVILFNGRTGWLHTFFINTRECIIKTTQKKTTKEITKTISNTIKNTMNTNLSITKLETLTNLTTQQTIKKTSLLIETTTLVKTTINTNSKTSLPPKQIKSEKVLSSKKEVESEAVSNSGKKNSGIPKQAIAVIAVIGVFILLALLAYLQFCLIKKKNSEKNDDATTQNIEMVDDYQSGQEDIEIFVA